MALTLGLHMKIRALSALVASVLTTGLVAWHKFTATTWTGSNRLPDSSPVGTNTAALYTGRGLSFDGVNDVVTVGATGVTVKTVVFYAYPDTTTTAFMQLQSTGAVRIEIASGTLSATGFTSPTLYVNGAASSTVAASAWQMIAVTSATGVSASNLLLGQSNATFYGGDLSNVKMFSTQLSAAQLAELYANPEQALPTGSVAADLVGWWPMTSANGSAAYNAIFAAKGGLISGATWVTGLPSPLPQPALMSSSSYMIFDGSNDAITGTADAAGTAMSVRAKVANTNDSGFQYIFYIGGTTSGTGFALARTNASDFLYYFNGTTDYNSTYALTTGVLVDCVLTINLTSVKMYVNNTLVLNSTVPSTNVTNLNYYIGRNSTGSGFSFWNGHISEIAFWNAELDATDVSNLYSGTLPSAVKSANLQFYYPNKGNTSSNWTDEGTLANNGTVAGSPSSILAFNNVTTGKDMFGNSLKNVNSSSVVLHGSSYASITDAATLDITTAITLEAWVKPFSVSAAQTIIGKTGSYALKISSGAKLTFSKWTSAANSSAADTTNIVANVWTHVAVTYDGTNARFYINGAAVTSPALSGALDATSADVLLGALTSSTELFNGYIDSAKVYDSALTAANILNNYSVEAPDYA